VTRLTTEQIIQRLEHEREILRTLYAYAHALDYGVEVEFSDCWLDDACLYWPRHEPYRGRDAIMDIFRRHTHAPEALHKHLVMQPQIEIDGDVAVVESYYMRLDWRPDGPIVRSFGRYRDILKLCPDSRWRFRERRAENEASVPGLPSSVER
jgi:hypothetical protein